MPQREAPGAAEVRHRGEDAVVVALALDLQRTPDGARPVSRRQAVTVLRFGLEVEVRDHVHVEPAHLHHPIPVHLEIHAFDQCATEVGVQQVDVRRIAIGRIAEDLRAGGDRQAP